MNSDWEKQLVRISDDIMDVKKKEKLVKSKEIVKSNNPDGSYSSSKHVKFFLPDIKKGINN
jgi:hypothetical protein